MPFNRHGQALCALAIGATIIALTACNAGFNEFTRKAGDAVAQSRAPSQADTALAVRHALSQGVTNAIGLLGKTDGFNANQLVHIAVPEDLRQAEQLLRKAGQGKYVDQFVLTLNRAAEQAVPRATSIFADAISQMTINDAINIIKGPQDAATQYFRRSAGPQLTNSFRPVVQNATDQVGVTQSYKKMIDKAGVLGRYISDDAKDIDGYITGRATDALFLYIADEEKKIRENPLARTTEILKKVFGYYLG